MHDVLMLLLMVLFIMMDCKIHDFYYDKSIQNNDASTNLKAVDKPLVEGTLMFIEGNSISSNK